MIRFATSALAFCILAAPVSAQDDDVTALYEALRLPDIITIMREEGLAYGDDLAAEMLPGGGSADWRRVVSGIYDADRMAQTVQGAFTQALDGADVAAMVAFFETEQGQRITGLEVQARRAMLDPDVEEASRDEARLQMADETDRIATLEPFIEANDLIESNVVGALNSSYAFYLGLIDGGVMPAGVTPESALQDVWMQEPDIRTNTIEWVYAFLLLAYEPLSDDEIAAYTEFSESDAGQELNTALFAAFDGMFDNISRALGLASAQFMISQEL